jgi:hypothetical protein
LAGALQLDEAERAHLFDLARTAGPVPARRPRPAKQRVQKGLARRYSAYCAVGRTSALTGGRAWSSAAASVRLSLDRA